MLINTEEERKAFEAKEEGKIIFEWDVPEERRTIEKVANEGIAEGYRVLEKSEAASGIIIYAYFRGEWHANAGNDRPIVKHLLDLIQDKGK